MEQTRLTTILSSEKRWQELCNLLDGGKYWEKLAIQINTPPNEGTRMKEITSTNLRFSPSRTMLDDWQHREEATIGTFMEILQAINHHTAYNLVLTWLSALKSTDIVLMCNENTTNVNDNTTNTRHEDVKTWLKRKRFESLESKMEELGVEQTEDLEYMEQEWVMELANTLKPIPRKKFLHEMGILCSPINQRKNTNQDAQHKQPGEEEYQQAMPFYWKDNYIDALPLFEKAASLKYPPAFIRLKLIYEKGKEIDKAKTVSEQCTEYAYWFIEQMQGGDMTAQYNLALYYNYISKDHKQAFYWYNKLANQEVPFGQHALALCYQKGEGTTKNLSQTVYWFQKAADQGYARAQLNLGVCYEFGKGVEKDISQAVCWFQKAADQGYARAQLNLGVCYEFSKGVEKDISQAAHWYKKAADQEDPRSQLNLGFCYELGKGVKQNISQAMYWFQKAADQGYACAQLNLGVCYELGEGVEKDISQAVNWYKKAADQNYAIAQCIIGCCYSDGIGVAQDYEQAVYWFKKGVDQSDPRSMYFYAKACFSGKGAPQNYSEALHWYKKSADQGYAPAQQKLARLTASSRSTENKVQK